MTRRHVEFTGDVGQPSDARVELEDLSVSVAVVLAHDWTRGAMFLRSIGFGRFRFGTDCRTPAPQSDADTFRGM